MRKSLIVFLIATSFGFLFAPGVNAQSCLDLQKENENLQRELSKPLDLTPCKMFLLFGDLAEKIAPESGIDKLYRGSGELICEELLNERIAKEMRREEVKSLLKWCF